MFNPKFAALLAFGMSFLLVIVKAVVWFFSNSSTVLASLADSIQDCFLSATNFMAVRYAMLPADEDHRYGHGKMEGIAALGQSAFIFGACVFILLDVIRNFGEGEATQHTSLIIWVMAGAIVANALLVIYQGLVVKYSRSLAIEADKANYTGDIMIHAGVIIAAAMDGYLGLSWADPVIAVGIASWLLYLAYTIGIKAINMLMDKELPESEREDIKKTIRKTRDVIGLHDLRTHRHGQITMMSFDIEVDPSLKITDAHNIAKRVEDRLHKAYPESEIMIHIDPCGDITDSRHKKIKKHHVK
jgi:ferrous-iron efflux pump FieF